MAKAHWEQLVAHAREEAPNECCGYMRLSDGLVEEVVRAVNEYESPRYGYVLDSDSTRDAALLSEAGHEIATYHSHPRSPAEPSQTDINIAYWPEWVYVIVSPEGDPQVRAWRIEDGRVEEEQLTVE